MSSTDPYDNPNDQYGLIYRKLDNIHIMIKNHLRGISLSLVILVVLELYKLLRQAAFFICVLNNKSSHIHNLCVTFACIAGVTLKD